MALNSYKIPLLIRKSKKQEETKMKRTTAKRFAGLMITALAAMSLTACGGSSSGSSAPAETKAAAEAAEGTVYKVGIVQYVDDASLNQIQDNIQKELDAKGAELGVTFDYADYTFNGQADGTVLNQIASELIADEVDIIIPIATPTVQIMQAATEDLDIPIVFSAVSDPVGAGLAESMEAPGGKITGTSDMLNTESLMNLIFAANPDADSIGLLYSKSESASEQPIADAKAILDKMNVKYVEKTGTTVDEVSTAADALIAEGVDAIFTPTDNTVMTAELAIYEKIANASILHYAGADSFALNGAFCGYGVNYADLGTATADMAVEILVNGADPATMPVQTFDNGIATINTDVCTTLNLDLETIKSAFAEHCSSIVEITTAENFE